MSIRKMNPSVPVVTTAVTAVRGFVTSSVRGSLASLAVVKCVMIVDIINKFL